VADRVIEAVKKRKKDVLWKVMKIDQSYRENRMTRMALPLPAPDPVRILERRIS
jgi:hypothetical protein